MNTMISPFTGGELRFSHERRELTYRKEKFEYTALFYVCVDSGEKLTTTELDTINVNQVYNQYRSKYGIPFPDEIKAIREMYGLSASKMSVILGLGANQYRLYENGEVPSEAIGKTLRSIMNPSVFITYVQNSESQFTQQELSKIYDKIEGAMKKTACVSSAYKMPKRSIINGYAPVSISQVKNIILFYINKLGGVFSTKMNKLLFYTDFYSYKTLGYGMTGLAYKAIQYGPVPFNWNVLYGSMEDIDSEIISFPSGNSGEQLVSAIQPDMSTFLAEELNILNDIVSKFGSLTANQLSELSHSEDAWQHYVGTSLPIDYTEAFTLKAL